MFERTGHGPILLTCGRKRKIELVRSVEEEVLNGTYKLDYFGLKAHLASGKRRAEPPPDLRPCKVRVMSSSSGHMITPPSVYPLIPNLADFPGETQATRSPP